MVQWYLDVMMISLKQEMMMQKLQEYLKTLVQLSWPWQPGGGTLFGDSAPSRKVHGVKVGEEEGRDVERKQENQQDEVKNEGETLGVQGGWW